MSPPTKLIFRPREYKQAKEVSKNNRHSYLCVVCGSCENITNHHLIPRKKGGKGRKHNTIKVCRECHDTIHGFQTKKVKLTKLIKKYMKTHNTDNVYEIANALDIQTQDVVMIVFPDYWKRCLEKYRLRTMKELSSFLDPNSI